MSNDRGEIANLMAEYCRTYDNGDFVSYARLFDHGEVGAPGLGLELKSDQAIIDFHTANCLMYDGKPNTRHVITNLHIEIDADRRSAAGECYVTISNAAPGFPLQPIFIGTYRDKFHKIDGKWRFKECFAEPHLVGAMNHHAHNGGLPPTHVA